MALKNVENANFLQIDKRIEKIVVKKGIEILPSLKAWEKYEWTRKYYKEKPKEGYFLWVKKQINFPITTCILISSKKVKQNLKNLIVIEKNVKAKSFAICSSSKENLEGSHNSIGKVVLKENAELETIHLHTWGKKDLVVPKYEYFLMKGSKLFYTFKSLQTPKRLTINNIFYLNENAKLSTKILINANFSNVKINEKILLEGKNASAESIFRMVAQKNSKIFSKACIVGLKEVKGHLDCQGLLIDESSQINLIPELVVKSKNAILTHEASIGKIAEEQLFYLRTRGLSVEEAIDLIVMGFLK